MKCPKCEEEKKMFKGSPSIRNGEYKAMWETLNDQLEYLTYQCETRTQLKPVELTPITRYMCSNQHSWSVKHEH
jgi:hypothetical protein